MSYAGALSQTMMRARRLVRLFAEVREQSGSVTSALGYTGRVVLRKMPMAWRQVRMATRYRGTIRAIECARQEIPAVVPMIGVKVSGGLGDYVVIARFLRDLRTACGDLAFDVYATQPDQAEWIFRSTGGLRACHDDMLFDFTLDSYDLAARASQFVVFQERAAKWSTLHRHPRLARAVAHAMRYRPKLEPFIERHPFLDGFLAQKAVYANRTRADFLHDIAGIPYGGDRLDIEVAEDAPGRFGLAGKPYVTVHNGYDPGFIIRNEHATKCYPYFGPVIAQLRRKFPDITFVQLGVDTSVPLPEADVNLLNKTSLREAAGLLKHATLHVDNEGGLVHLARSLGTDSCVVFGPTPSSYFGYAGNINIDPTFCGGCWWINETWMNQCPRGFPTARCMTEQQPADVAAAIEAYLRGARPSIGYDGSL